MIIHDRKGDYSWLSTSKCVPKATPTVEDNPGSTQDVYLWGLSDDGKKALITSAGSNMIDNLKLAISSPPPRQREKISSCTTESRRRCFLSPLGQAEPGWMLM